MSRRRALLAFGLLSLVWLLVLLIVGARRTNPDSFSNTQPLLVDAGKLDPGQRGCQGPIAAPSGFHRVSVFLDNAGPATVRLTVRGARSGAVLASGGRSIDVREKEQPIELNAEVAARPGVTLCLVNDGPRAVALLGSAKTNVSGTFAIAGQPSVNAAAFLFERERPRSQLSLLPTALQRAALFKPSWFGAWTFWVLLVGVLAGFVLIGAAIRSALHDDRP